jgi:hypothetical protein
MRTMLPASKAPSKPPTLPRMELIDSAAPRASGRTNAASILMVDR